MYEGSNKTALLSQKLITEAMLRLLENKTFSEINVSDICREADVSRQTFYTNFGTKDNVILHILSCNCRYTPEQKQQECRGKSFRDFCEGYSRYIIEHRRIIELLVRNDMIHYLYDIQYREFLDCEHFVHDIQGDERLYLVDFIAGGLSSIAKNYILTGGTADGEFLMELMLRLFGGEYFG